MTLDVHIVSHTHWDREWYHPAERFRQRLVALVDELLDEPPSPGESFLLDGQAIVLEDYLAVRPERDAQLRSLLQTGQLEAGPWYVLSDELIPSGEALVRNLIAGRRVLERLDATAPPILYCPDSFGHPAALPAIAAGFGLPIVIAWRGYGGARWPAGDTATWSAPSGDDVLLFHLPRNGYEFGSHLPLDADSAAVRWNAMRDELVPRSTTGVMLVQNGADHHARQRGHHEALSALERAGKADGVHRSSLRAFAERLLERAGAQRLPIVRGELRDSYGYTWALQGTFGTRAHQKRLNAIAERVLLREAEPWSALAAYSGASRRGLIAAAWRSLLAAQPHDTLCGCSIDEVALAMELRVRSATNQAHGIRDDSIADVIAYDADSAREARARWNAVVLIRNPAPRPRSGVAIIEIEEFVADVPVGPGSAPTSQPHGVDPRHIPVVPTLGALQVLSRSMRNSRTESLRHYPDNDLVAVTRVAAWVADAPPYGIVSHSIAAGDATYLPTPSPVVVANQQMSNGNLVVDVGEDGRVSLTHTETERRIPSLLDVIDEADVGDLYTPAPRTRDVATEFLGVRRMHRGPLRGELALRFRIVDPSGARRRLDVQLVVHLTLDAGAHFLRVGVSGENWRRNHRLRLLLRGDVRPGAVWADAAFGPVRREPIAIAPAEAEVEAAPPTAPLHRYVSAFSDDPGFTVFSDGLAEYEATAEGIAITLVRSVGELSRNDLPERPGHAGWPTPTPGAQCLGLFGAEFAVLLHGPRTPDTIDHIERTADDVLCPITGTTLRSALQLPAPVRGPELMGLGLAFSACKESDDGGWLVLRCVNLRDEDVAGVWRLPFAPREAHLARIDETRMSTLDIFGADVPFQAQPRGIVTILVR